MSTDVAEPGTMPESDDSGAPPAPDVTPSSPESDGDHTPDTQNHEPPESPTSLLDAFGDEHFRSKYKTDAEFKKAVKEMQTTLSRRDELAAYGKAVQQFEPEFREFLEAKRQPQQAPPATPAAPSLPKPQEVALLKARVLDANGQVREGAKPEDIRKLQEVTEVLEQRMYEYLLDPEGFVGKFVEPKLSAAQKAAAEQAQQEVARARWMQAEEAKVNQFVDSHAEWIFANGKNADEGLSAQGERLKAYTEQLAGEFSDRNGNVTVPESKLVEMAFWRLRSEQTDAVTKPGTKTTKGVRKPNNAHPGESLQAQKARKIADGVSMSELADWCERNGLEL